ncbi:MAG: L-2-hydroxyglutarate oxidase [Candidatus Promineifilaceae bacterium]
MSQYDMLIIGGGLVGLATAYRYLQQYPNASVLLVEKESAVGQHQSGRNSGVLHSGIYYKPGSLRATMCRSGKALMEQFCDEHAVDYDLCGKVIVAKEASELPAMQRIYERGQANGVACELIGRERLLELEPHVRGVQAIHVPEAGIADYPAVAKKLAGLIVAKGGEVRCDTKVIGLQESPTEVVVQTNQGDFSASRLISCAGLYSDRVAEMAGVQSEVTIVPFRGEYFQLRPQAEHYCRGLIYPVPDTRFPFLGVHFTKMIEGGVDCGPNAVLAFAREGYKKSDVNLRELGSVLGYAGFQKLAFKYWAYGLGEMWRSFNKRAFVSALRGLIPEVNIEDLAPHPAGVRATALTRNGEMFDDFAFAQTARTLHVINAPSPAATASLVIGQHIVAMVDKVESNK